MRHKVMYNMFTNLFNNQGYNRILQLLIANYFPNALSLMCAVPKVNIGLIYLGRVLRKYLTHCGLVTPYGVGDLGQH